MNNENQIMEKQETGIPDIEKIKADAFLEGYKYAIKVLTDGLVEKEKTK